MVNAPDRLVLVRAKVARGLSERHALTVIGISARAPRYEPAAGRNKGIVALAQQHKRYGAGMIYLKLRQAGEVVNHKRVDRLYDEKKLQVRRINRRIRRAQ